MFHRPLIPNDSDLTMEYTPTNVRVGYSEAKLDESGGEFSEPVELLFAGPHTAPVLAWTHSGLTFRHDHVLSDVGGDGERTDRS